MSTEPLNEERDGPESEETEAQPRETRRPMGAILILPSLITLGSTFCGFLAIAWTADAMATNEGGGVGAALQAYMKIGQAGLLLFLAMVFDALDGRVARFSHMTTEFGGQLDSLSDAISFGVAPAFMAKTLIEIGYPDLNPKVTLLLGVLFVICTVLRLARYNVEHDSQVSGLDHFRGLPSPGAAGLIASIALVVARVVEDGGDPGLAIKALLFLTFISAVLMISRFRYVHVMNRFLRGRKPFTYLVVIVFVLVFCYIVQEWAAALILTVFVLSGPLGYIVAKLTGRGADQDGPLFD
jgi:CDP-diacylglycerol---serine O-phosphatidyltransferase